MLKKILDMEAFTVSPLFNGGKLLSLKVSNSANVIEFKDSCMLLSMPLKKFNKDLDLGLNMEKEV